MASVADSRRVAQGAARSAPAVLIRIDFESRRPRVLPDYIDEGDRARMHDWITSQPELLDLVARAIELENAA
jgi:hypothetical protein